MDGSDAMVAARGIGQGSEDGRHEARMNGLPRRLMAALPPEVHKAYYRLRDPEYYGKLQSLRTREISPDYPVTLAPMIARRAVFVHIPKCAGLSVADALFGCRGGGHLPITAYRLALTGREFREFFKFTFVRNPWDRVHSAYRFLKAGGLVPEDAARAERIIVPFPDFDAFLRGFIAGGDIWSAVHFRPQHAFVCLTGRSAPAVDFVGRYERLEDDYRHVCDRIGVEARLARLNPTGGSEGDYRRAYSDATAEIVARAYARDVELFGYSFDGGAS
ncbi:sulfotransferase family 2 domain-containing protein [Tropicimonas sediminicola]|uniref:Sulfotransferase family protein n=1 Tax=Tropicimonas sediminicola TaxID=1031541 RepID=A0A239H9Z7_9RHOB|nr:sulfotransferase family 2 domain-containing protein [Tropicimonas sediminicola]SNS77878.1 Sulfotransferase family protein [Tropicimonas sediminicola]